MKTNLTISDRCQVTSGGKAAATWRLYSGHSSRVTRHFSAFTLIELLVVISIIGVLAAFIFTIAGGVTKNKYITMTRAEMGKIESAIESYHSDRSFYPPGGVNNLVNPLYYELVGTTINGLNYVTLDSSAQIPVAQVNSAFGVNGFVNCTKGSGEDASPAKSYLSGLKPQQFGTLTTNTASSLYYATLLLGSAGGPDKNYATPGYPTASNNPWRYKSPGTYNPNSYDLWMQLVISGKTNLVCNWSKQVQINFPLP